MTEIANYETKRLMITLFDDHFKEIVRNVCGALDSSDRADEMIARYIYDLKWKKRKDVNAPTKPRSSYLLWTESVRAGLKKANPALDMPAMSKKMGELWKAMSDDDKTPFVEAAEADKLRYADEKKKYDAEVHQKTSALQGSGSQNASTAAEAAEAVEN